MECGKMVQTGGEGSKKIEKLETSGCFVESPAWYREVGNRQLIKAEQCKLPGESGCTSARH
jgi:hypothetical protein